MNREFLTPFGLSKEDVEKIMAEHGKTTAAIKDKVTTQFTTQLTEVQAEVTNLNGVIATRDKDIEDLKKSNKTVDDLNTQLSDLQSKYATEKTEREAAKVKADEELIQTKKRAAAKLKAVERKALDVDMALMALDGFDELDYADKDFDKKLDAKFDTALEVKSFLFGKADPAPPATPQITVGGNPQGTPSSDQKTWRDRMNENVANAKKIQ